MGIWDLIGSTTDKLKSNIGFVNTVSVNGVEKLNEYMPDEDRREKIWSFATKFVKNASVFFLKEGYKFIPGGEAVGKIVSVTAREMEEENKHGATKKKAWIGNKDEGSMDQPTCGFSGVDKKPDLNVEKTKDDTIESDQLVKSAGPQETAGSRTSIRSKL